MSKNERRDMVYEQLKAAGEDVEEYAADDPRIAGWVEEPLGGEDE